MNSDERESKRFNYNKASGSPKLVGTPAAGGGHRVPVYLFLPALFLVLARSVAAHSVGLTWVASTSVVSGYNVYRGKHSGGPDPLVNSALDTGTTYTDATVQAGQTYFYVATAVSPSGVESTYSNEVQVTVPYSSHLSVSPTSLSFGNVTVGS